MVMDILEKWIQENRLQDHEDIDALLEAADMTRQLIQDKNYEGEDLDGMFRFEKQMK